MKRLFCALFVCAAMLAGCGDDDSDFMTRPDGSVSSSSAKSNWSSVTPNSNGSTEDFNAPVKPCKREDADNCEYGTLVDERDGQVYKTVKIGDQEWMAENLNFVTDSSCCYKYSSDSCAKYGRLYRWSIAMDSAGTWSTNGQGCGSNPPCSPIYPVQGICPQGWHLPDTTEWAALFTAVGGIRNDEKGWQWDGVGKKLKSETDWKTEDFFGPIVDGGNGVDAYGFYALPAGFKYSDGDYINEGETASFWTSNPDDFNNAYNVDLPFCFNYARMINAYGAPWKSVRCIKD